MSIKVQNISKIYGEQKALDNVSFEVKPGEIVGLLGPNGAGKSTIMKILTCFIPPNSGNAWIHDYDIHEQSLEVRKNIGYLPENNPLYLDMYVKEYLEFIAGIHELKNKQSRVKEMIEITGLHIEQNKKIGALSKGFRQRIGLAQAMIHNPKVLILDEPTSGLDPNQLTEIRNLISKIGKEKTVMLSTHIMQEVEAICHRAIIIDQGKIVADNKTSDLAKASFIKETISVEFKSKIEKSLLMRIKGVNNVKNINGNLWIIDASSKDDIRPLIFKMAVDNQLTVLSLNKEEKSLEEVFQHLTKK